MVKSESTKDMNRIELIGIQENLKNSDHTEIEGSGNPLTQTTWDSREEGRGFKWK